MQRSSSSDRVGLFSDPNTITTCEGLERELSRVIDVIVAYEPYIKQTQLESIFDKKNPKGAALLTEYVEKGNLNASNNVGMTFLHLLLATGHFDLAKQVCSSPRFDKINFKFCIPTQLSHMYVSALDNALLSWLDLDNKLGLDFIEVFLQNGATPPNPTKRFMHIEFISFFYPMIIQSKLRPEGYGEIPACRSRLELLALFGLLQRYGFEIETMLDHFQKRLFEGMYGRNVCEDFAKNYDVTPEQQKEVFDEFKQELLTAIKDLQPCKPLVEMTPERLSDGKDTLMLPFDPNNAPCSVM